MPLNKQSRVPKLLRFVMLGDTHYGVEREYAGNGFMLEKPIYAREAIEPTLDFIKDFQPHVLGLMGDQVDCLPVSRHVLNKPRETEGQRLQEDIQRFEMEFLKPLEKSLMPSPGLVSDDAVEHYHEKFNSNKCLRIWLDGNHEAWADHLATLHPGITGLVEPREVLGLTKRKWNVRPQGHLLKLGKWKGTHGDVILGFGGGRATQYPSRKALDVYGSSVRIWHTHQKQYIVRPVMADESYHSAVCVPGLCNRSPGYLRNAPNRYMHGFCWGYVFPDGFFDDVIQVIWKGRFVANEKVYQYRSKKEDKS